MALELQFKDLTFDEVDYILSSPSVLVYIRSLSIFFWMKLSLPFEFYGFWLAYLIPCSYSNNNDPFVLFSSPFFSVFVF